MSKGHCILISVVPFGLLVVALICFDREEKFGAPESAVRMDMTPPGKTESLLPEKSGADTPRRKIAVLPVTGTISGIVTLPERKPAGYVMVRLHSATGELTSATTDRMGRFSLKGFEAATYRLVASSPGYTDGIVDSVVLTHRQPYREVRIRLGQGATIAGRILDESGRGIVRAHLQFWRPDLPSHVESVTTDKFGAYRLRGVDKGELLLHAEKEGYAKTSPVDYRVVGDGIWPGPDIVLCGETPLSGVVVASDFSVLADAILVAVDSDGYSQQVRSSGDGSFQIGGLASPPYLLVVVAGGRRASSLRIDSRPVQPVRIVLDDSVISEDRGGPVITGTVPAGAVILCVPVNSGLNDAVVATPDRGGIFVLSVPSPGRYNLLTFFQHEKRLQARQTTINVSSRGVEHGLEMEE